MLNGSSSAAKNIAGEITLSENCSESMRRWRQIFGVKQSELAKRLNVSPSVISDYESGRRLSPGTHVIKRLVETLVTLDIEKGGKVLSKFTTLDERPDAILCIEEFQKPIDAKKFLKAIDGEVIVHKHLLNSTQLQGYTVIDSIQAILNLDEKDFLRIYGSSTERALIFTKVKLGRSPMIAIKVTQHKPSLIVLHGLKPENVDQLAKHIAEKDRIPLAVSQIESEDELIEKLKRELT